MVAFGNHSPGAGRGAMRRPRWDILHPARLWASPPVHTNSSLEKLGILAVRTI
ncbi:MAG: Eco29kI family restriction endonuclease [Phycisphaerae bacterium]|nr:Eco29kI family restriction endonuclease [Phycisphaerae bacterium]